MTIRKRGCAVAHKSEVDVSVRRVALVEQNFGGFHTPFSCPVRLGIVWATGDVLKPVILGKFGKFTCRKWWAIV